MQTYKIEITPVSPGTQVIESQRSIQAGSGQYAKLPTGPVVAVLDLTAAQVVGIQGYLSAIDAGTNTGAVETAITALTPT